MGMAEEEWDFYLVTKYVDGSSLNKKLRASDVVVLDEIKSTYTTFKPCNSTDFDRGIKYGVIEGDTVRFIRILKMAENEEDLNYGRVKVPKRWSNGPTSAPLKIFKVAEEGAAAKESSKFTSGKFRKHERLGNAGNIEEAKNNKKVKKNKKDKKERSHTDSTQVVKKSKIGVTSAQHIDTDKQQSDCTNCLLLKKRIADLEGKEKELEVSQAQVCDLQAKLAVVEKRQDDISNKDMLKCLEAKLEEANSRYKKQKEFLEDEKFLVKVKEKDQDIVLSDSEVYCGNGIKVAKDDLHDAARGTTFGRRVARIVDCFYPDTVHQHFLSGSSTRAPPGPKIHRITDEEIKAIKKILKKMPWDTIPTVPELNSTNIAKSVKYYTSQCLTKYLKSNQTSKGKVTKKATRRRSSSWSGEEEVPASQKPHKNTEEILSEEDDSDD